jgi:hypothetical protein
METVFQFLGGILALVSVGFGLRFLQAVKTEFVIWLASRKAKREKSAEAWIYEI